MNTKLLLPMMLFLMMVGLGNALTLTAVLPANNSVISGGNVVFNVTCSDCASQPVDNFNVTYNVTIVDSLGLRSISYTLNTSLSVNYTTSRFNVTFNTSVLRTGLNDSAFYEVTAVVIASNSTATSAKLSSTGIIVDNGVPGANTAVDITRSTSRTTTITATVPSSSTTRCSWVSERSPTLIQSSFETSPVNERGGSCSQAFILGDGIYSYRVRTSDGTNTTLGPLNTLTVVLKTKSGITSELYALGFNTPPDGSGGALVDTSGQPMSGSITPIILIIGALVLLGTMSKK